MIDPFRITEEDLSSLDAKTVEGLAPLLDALNTTLQQLVATANAVPQVATYDVEFTSGPAGTAYVDFSPKFSQRARSVVVDQIRRTDEAPMTAVYSQSWTFIAAGVRMLFAGLDNDTQYQLAVTIR